MLTEQAAARASGTLLRSFEDGFGRRYRPATRAEGIPPLEILCFRREITDLPSFDFALRERVARLSDFRHPDYTRIRKVERLTDKQGTVALMSEGAPGVRLNEILADVDRSGPVLDVNASLCLIRQLVSAIGALHDHARVAHGAIAPERLFVTPAGRVCIVEYVMGAALEQLKYSRERYWKELRVALPVHVGLPRVDERADLTQVGMVALSLMLARPIREDEYPGQIEDLVRSACSRTSDGGREPLPSGLRNWLRCALQLDARSSFRSLSEAKAAFDQLLSEDGKHSADPGSLDAFLEHYHNATKPAPPPPKLSLVPDNSVLRIEPRSEMPPVAPLDAEPMAAAETSGKRPFDRFKWIAAGLVVMMATTGGLLAARRHRAPSGVPLTVGFVTVNSNPPGAAVEVDGGARGQTPITLALTPGAHTLVIRGSGEPRTMPITIAAGAELSQYIELPKAVSSVGQLQVRTEPAGARVRVDGIPVGKTPVTVAELSPGEHTVTLDSDLGSVTQKVMIEAGIPASLVVSLMATPGAVLSGWVSVTAPFVMELYEQGRLLGTSGIDRIMLPTGTHEIELVNGPLDYRETQTVHVSAGRVSAISVILPKGTVSINAVPSASVSIDGENVGDTPIENFPITIGPHEVVFRNPELGEQRRVVTVTARSPVRLSVDLTQK